MGGSIFLMKLNKENESKLLTLAMEHSEKVNLSKEEYGELREKVQKEVMQNVSQEYLVKYRDTKAKEEIKKQVRQTVEKLYPSLNYQDKLNIIESLTNEISGYGILEKYLNDEDVTEILVERYNRITVEKDGTLYETDDKFDSEEHLNLVIERIISPWGRQLNWSTPTVNARLPDGSRVAATHSRVSVDEVNAIRI